MKNQKLEFVDSEEISMLSNQVSPEEMFIIGFLKGFDRKTLKEWEDKQLLDFSIDFLEEPSLINDELKD